jgi:asparagine synthase (glutamine-hydrolysing)
MYRPPTLFGIGANRGDGMSVQAGIWNFDGAPVDPKLISDFHESLKLQGPDGESAFVESNVAMLYRPFHTTGESRREKQPYITRRGFILTWDGRLDNRDELICEVRNELEPDAPDVAVVAAAFDRWETACFHRMVGDWAIAIWKPKHRELIFAVDYMAIRHIFYYLKRNRISWSSDLTPLILLSGDKLHIDDAYIVGYFVHDPDAYLTPFREIREVPPGQFVHIRDGRMSIDCYWQFKPGVRIRYKTDAEYEEHFRTLFREAVCRRLRSDSPVLAELSGGLDSSSIVCMADDIISKNAALTVRLDTISYYDKTEPNGDDWIYFPRVEEKRARTGVHIDLGEIRHSPAGLQYPSFVPLPGSLGTELPLERERAQVVRQGSYRVVLSGIGGDEFLGGIPDPTPQLADLILQFRILKLARQLIGWSLVKRRPWIGLLGQAFLDLLPPSLTQYSLKRTQVEPWFTKRFVKHNRSTLGRGDACDSHFLLCTRRSMVRAVQMMRDRLAKFAPPVSALEETRYPYLDQNLIEFLFSIPANQVLRPGERRSLMRRSLVGIVPSEILSRRTKQFGARTPVVVLDNNRRELQMIFDRPLSATLGYIDRDRLLQTLHAALGGQTVHVVRLLRTISLEFWLRDISARGLIEATTLPRELVEVEPVQPERVKTSATTFRHSC